MLPHDIMLSDAVPWFAKSLLTWVCRWFFEDRGETACVPSPCIGAGSQLPYQDTSPGMGIFFKGAHMCGTKEDLPPEVKASAVCVIEGVSHAPPTPALAYSAIWAQRAVHCAALMLLAR